MESLIAHGQDFAVALGCGLLIGIERERRKGRGAGRAPAGVRTFTLTSLAGALAQSLGQPLLVAAGAVLVLALIAVHYVRTRSSDPGITTELALFVTYLLGVASIGMSGTAAAGAVVVALLLFSRTRLHRFSTQVLTEQEVRDALILAGAALVVMPLIPERPIGLLGGLDPSVLWRLVVVLLALQAAGYVAMRALGPRIGLALSGLASGFVSSTATFGAMGARARALPALTGACVAGALFSNIATLIQMAVVAATVSPPVLALMWPVFAAGGAASVVAALFAASRTTRQAADPPVIERVFDLPGSLAFAAILSGVTALAAWFGDRFGPSAAMIGTAVAGFVDVHASLASVGAIVQSGRLEAAQAVLPVLLGFTANTASKAIAAFVSGGLAYASRVLPGLLLLLAVVWSVAFLR
jgi:uncharacterized membrane protein (DUF4010 family)